MDFDNLVTTGNGANSYVNSNYGMYCITNYGVTWELCYTDSYIYAIAVSGDGSLVFFADYYSINVHANATLTTVNVTEPTPYPTRKPTISSKPTNAPMVEA